MKKRLFKYLNLESELEDFDQIHNSIQKEIIFKGTNLWILVFAIIVASVGLNINSPAVIIGAMLISPLMGPINGMGYSIATYNFILFRRSLNNFLFAVIASLIASTAYFSLSPLSTAHSELLARTSPTIYDVIIALFGGFAGITAISSKQKGNVIPGVAIATALMPPLCTAGYGLATAQFTYFFGAMYLFTINTVFIGFSSVAFSQILKFPIRTLVDATQKSRVNRWISFVIFITIIPSIYFGYGLIQKEKFTERANKFAKSISVFEGNYLLKYEIEANKKALTLIFGGNSLTENHKLVIKQRAKDFNLNEVQLNIQQGFSFTEYNKDLSEIDKLKGEITRLNLQLKEKGKEQKQEERISTLSNQLIKEIQPIYPHLAACFYAEASIFNQTSKLNELTPIIIFKQKNTISTSEKKKIEGWLKSRLNKKEVIVVYK